MIHRHQGQFQTVLDYWNVCLDAQGFDSAHRSEFEHVNVGKKRGAGIIKQIAKSGK
jgi:hypothetical protein